jgi:hypothetical protein
MYVSYDVSYIAGSDIIKRKLAIEAINPIFNDKMKRRKVTMIVVVKEIMPRENLEQIKPAAMNIAADIASTAA